MAASPPIDVALPPGDSALVHASGIRLGVHAGSDARARAPSSWQLAATLSWLLVLAALGGFAPRFGLWLSWVTCGLQAGLIAVVFMRLASDRRVHWMLGVVAMLVVGFLTAAVLLDRSECQPELDHFESTPMDPSHAAVPAAD
jgi:hypothetical protein